MVSFRVLSKLFFLKNEYFCWGWFLFLSVVRGKELPFLVLAPGRRILQFSVLHETPASTFYREVVGFLEKHGGRLLGGYTQLVEGGLNIPTLWMLRKRLKSLRKLFNIFSAEIFSQVLDRLYELLSSGAALILQEMGKKHGEEMTLALKTMAEEANLTLQPIGLVELMLRYLQSCGWAVFRLRVVKEEPLDVEVEAQELFEPLALHGKSAEFGCNLFKGELIGIFSAAYGKKVKVEETSCKAKGASACIFKITE